MPFNPGNQDNSGQILAQGISGATSNIANMIDTLSQRTRQAKAFRTMAVDGLGMDPDQVAKMSLPQLQGTLQGAALKSANAQRAAQMQDLASQAKEREQIGQWRQSMSDRATSDQANQAAFNQMLAARSGGASMPAGAAMGIGGPAAVAATQGDGPMSAQEVMQMMGKANLSPEQMTGVARMMESMGLTGTGKASADFAPKQFNLGDSAGIYNPRTGNFTVTGNKGQPGLIDLHDEDGNPTGVKAAINPQTGKFQLLKQPAAATGDLKPVLDPVTKQPVPGFGVDSTGKIHDMRTAPQRAGIAPAAAAAAPAEGPLTKLWRAVTGGAKPAATAPPKNPSASWQNAAAAIKRTPEAREGILQRMKEAGESIDGL